MEVIVKLLHYTTQYNIFAQRGTEINILFVEYSVNIHADDVLLQRTHCLSFRSKHPKIPTGNRTTARQRAAGG